MGMKVGLGRMRAAVLEVNLENDGSIVSTHAALRNEWRHGMKRQTDKEVTFVEERPDNEAPHCRLKSAYRQVSISTD